MADTYYIQNGSLKAGFSSLGGELRSLVATLNDGSEVELLWSADPKYWSGVSPLLFPIVGRLNGGTYTHKGQVYEMGCHGFLRKVEHECIACADKSVLFRLVDNEASRSQYPFAFSVEQSYELQGTSLIMDATVRNTGDETLPFSIGRHPGFMTRGEFESWYLTLESNGGEIRHLTLAPSLLLSGNDEPTALLRDGKYIDLKHSIFENDAYIVSNVVSTTLDSPASPYSIRVTCEDADCVGYWHTMGSYDAPFVCLEPWGGCPALDGVADDTATKQGFKYLAPGESYTFRVVVEVNLKVGS